MSKIFIYGVPEVGKTYFSKLLGKELGYQVFEAYRIKSEVRKNKSKEEFPFLYLGTCQAYKRFGELNKGNCVKGLLAVREALNNSVEEKIKDYENVIIEGAFLDPQLLMQHGQVILLTTTDENKHKKQFYKHLEKLLDFSGSEFKSALMVQEYLIDEAGKLGVEIKDNRQVSKPACIEINL